MEASIERAKALLSARLDQIDEEAAALERALGASAPGSTAVGQPSRDESAVPDESLR